MKRVYHQDILASFIYLNFLLLNKNNQFIFIAPIKGVHLYVGFWCFMFILVPQEIYILRTNIIKKNLVFNNKTIWQKKILPRTKIPI